MRKLLCILAVAITMITGNATAETINGKLGFTGKLGAVVPFHGSEINGQSFSLADVGFVGGGGLIYGFGNNVAAELDVTHAPSIDVKSNAGAKLDEAQFTQFALGLQYRFMPEQQFVPYIGGGIDFIKGDIGEAELDWAVGGLVNVGVDYFVYRRMALNLECRGVFAEKSDIKLNGQTVGKFDPMSVVATFGVRLFLPEKWW